MTRNGTSQINFEYQPRTAETHEVLLLGDFTGWEVQPISLQRKRNGAWSAKVKLQRGQQYQYRYRVNGEWENDPDCEHVSNPFGTENCLVSVT